VTARVFAAIYGAIINGPVEMWLIATLLEMFF